MKGRLGVVLTGVLGVAILIGLCVWQVQRLAWKEGVIETLEARLSGAPAPLPERLDPDSQEFSRVVIRGGFAETPGAHGFVDAPLLTSIRPHGPG
ncbi:MAG: SURF1 family cytochrome oxidase biogenesis protein, partial [Pseudomonadota bacterium]